jgi:hypothetical protein
LYARLFTLLGFSNSYLSGGKGKERIKTGKLEILIIIIKNMGSRARLLGLKSQL